MLRSRNSIACSTRLLTTFRASWESLCVCSSKILWYKRKRKKEKRKEKKKNQEKEGREEKKEFAELHRLLDAFIDDLSSFMGIPLHLFQQDIMV
jgi:hypothetical protein